MGGLLDAVRRAFSGFGRTNGRAAVDVDEDADPRAAEATDRSDGRRSEGHGSPRGRRDPDFDPRDWVIGSGYGDESADEEHGVGGGRGGDRR